MLFSDGVHSNRVTMATIVGNKRDGFANGQKVSDCILKCQTQLLRISMQHCFIEYNYNVSAILFHASGVVDIVRSVSMFCLNFNILSSKN